MFTKFTALRLCSAAFLLLFALSSLNASSLFEHIRLYKSGVAIESSVAVGDVNGDGKPDLLTAGAFSFDDVDGEVGVLLATGKGKFGSFATYNAGGAAPSAIALGDVNGDGRLDVVVSNYNNIGVLLGNGDGTFQTAQSFGSGANAIALADVNGDGKLDLLLATNNTAEVRLGNGDGTFQTAQNYASWGYAIAAADVNGDGKLDMIMASAGIDVLLGNGDGTFQSAQVYPSGGNWPHSICVADVNGDGMPDLVVANLASSNVGVLLGNGDGTFQAVQTYDSGGGEADTIVVGDLNGDGKPDLAVANHYTKIGGTSLVGVLMGNGDGTFQVAQTFTTGGVDGGAIAIGNLTGSSMPDLVVSRCRAIRYCVEGMLGVLPNTTKGFITATSLSSSLNPSNYGQAVTFTASVTSAGPTPTGKVWFKDGTTGIGMVTLSGGVATLTKSKLAVGTHPITAQYLGDAASAKNTSSVLDQVVRRGSWQR
jgi:hypothetical protein